jgi:hypothetical protein
MREAREARPGAPGAAWIRKVEVVEEVARLDAIENESAPEKFRSVRRKLENS